MIEICGGMVVEVLLLYLGWTGVIQLGTCYYIFKD